MRHEFLVWQLIDSAFPSGGFAHSAGSRRRAARACRRRRRRARVRAAVARAVRAQRPAARDGGAPLPRAMSPSSTELSDVFLSNPVANRASRAQGRALLTTVARSFPDVQTDAFARVLGRRGCGHYAPLFGALFNAARRRISSTRSARSSSSRRAASAPRRCGSASSARTRRRRFRPSSHRTSTHVIHAAARSRRTTSRKPHRSIDLFQSTHDRLYSRLFQS